MKIDWKAYVKRVEELALKRAAGQHWKYTKNEWTEGYQSSEEIDFFTGAMVAFFFFNANDKIPASWIFNPLGNRSILDPEKLREIGLIREVKK